MKLQKTSPLYDRVRTIIESARHSVSRSVNTTQVVAYWLIGREIVEEEQKGRRRADYGKRMLERLAGRLTKEFGKGYSVQNLGYLRQLFLRYPSLIAPGQIPHAPRGKSSAFDSGAFQPLNPAGQMSKFLPDRLANFSH